MSGLGTLRMYGRFVTGLPGFLRRRMTVDEATDMVRSGLAERDDNFLRIVRAVREGSVAGSLAGSYWEQADSIQVSREEPVRTTPGKLPSLQVERRR